MDFPAGCVCVLGKVVGLGVPYIPPGKDRWLATPISLGLSWPLTNRHLLGVVPSTFTMV